MKWLWIILILMPVAHGWNCDTHRYICDEAGYEEYDCCNPDKDEYRKVFPYTDSHYHHCEANADDCEARKVADYYLNNTSKGGKEATLHLLSDSLVPVHWWATNYNQCHGKFEDLIDEKVNDNETWQITYRCELRNGSIFKIVMHKNYLNHVSDYVRNYTLGIPAYKDSNYLRVEDCTGIGKCGFALPYPDIVLYYGSIILAFLVLIYLGLKTPRRVWNKSIPKL